VNDCRNAEIRDQLPDLLHDRLSAGAREAVLAHLGDCAECRDELELIRAIHRVVMSGTPRIDVARVVSALPKPGASVVSIRPSRSRWADWRIAAAITVVAIGGTSVALLNRAGPSVRPDSVTFVAPVPSDTPASLSRSTNVAPSKSVEAQPVSVAETSASNAAALDAAGTADQGSDSVMEGRLRGLNEEQLRKLLDDIGQLKATPVTEPEPINIKVDVNGTRGSSGETEMQ
jgi:anti-sigma factor RsiW